MEAIWMLLGVLILTATSVDTSDYDLEEPTQCEVCKYFVTELQTRLDETGKSKEVLRTGHGMDPRKKKQINYATSELRLIEAMDGICEKIMEYNIHKERTGSLRFAKLVLDEPTTTKTALQIENIPKQVKYLIQIAHHPYISITLGMSETFKTLHGLRNKGVKVDLGIPEDMWDEPSVEITLLKKQCEVMLERHEESIEDWYFNHQKDRALEDFLCRDIVLRPGSRECLSEEWTGKETKYNSDDDDEKLKKRKKQKVGRKKEVLKGEVGDSTGSPVKEEL